MPALFVRMCGELCGSEPEVSMLAYSNRTLEWHRKEYFSVRFALLYGQYDYCVIQQYGHPFPGTELTEPALSEIVSLCRTARTTPVLFMTWAKKGERETFLSIRDDYRTLASKYDLCLAPIGELFYAVAESHPEIELYRHDGSHASAYGSYLITAALAAFLLHPKDLSALSDRSHDFHAHYNDEGIPTAEEDLSRVPVMLDAKYAAILRKTVENRILNHKDFD